MPSVAPTVHVLMVAQALSMGMSEFGIRRALETKQGLSREEAGPVYKEGQAYFQKLLASIK